MNKTHLLDHLKSAHKIDISRGKLDKVLQYMGFQQKDFSDEEVALLLEALGIIDSNGSREGYIKVAKRFGVNLEGLSKPSPRTKGSSRSNSSTTSTSSFTDTIREKIEDEIQQVTEEIVGNFFSSDKPYQMLVNVMNEQASTYSGTMERLQGSQMRNITSDASTLDISAKEVHQLPPDPDEATTPSVDDADFHAHNNSGGKE